MVPAPSTPKCANWARGCRGTRADFDAPIDNTYTPVPPVFLEGQRVGALELERKHYQKQERDAARSAQEAGSLGYQHAPGAGRMVRFAGASGGAPARGGRTSRWDAGGGQRQGCRRFGWWRRSLRAGARRLPAPPKLTGRAGAPPSGGAVRPRRIPPTRPHLCRPRPRRRARRAGRPSPSIHDGHRQPSDLDALPRPTRASGLQLPLLFREGRALACHARRTQHTPRARLFPHASPTRQVDWPRRLRRV